ncbi:unnamed protein product [Ranitomeya imitator]|uniref:Ig-like domain-containing protein n=1 Tax=Ranitomeya imitator TaxID=111125 RepID=A0ABN9M212_9NEOB|nr:unnamed protein product [Ranitomeya imitator]
MCGTNGRLLRWSLALQQFDFTIEHKMGKEHGNADGLSRQGEPTESQCAKVKLKPQHVREATTQGGICCSPDHKSVKKMKDLKNPLYILLISLVTSDGLTVTMKKPLISAVRGADVTIPCDISDFTLGRIITVTWSKSEGGHKSEVYSFIPGRAVAFRDGARMEEGNIQRGNAALHIPQAQFSDDGEYTCTVISPGKGEASCRCQVSHV